MQQHYTIDDQGNAVPSRPAGAVIEVIERTNDPDPVVIVPNDIRINGQSIYASAEHPVIVHEVATTLGDGLVYVTLTLVARRVVFDAEPKDGQ